MKLNSFLLLLLMCGTHQHINAQKNRVKIKFGEVNPGDFDSVRYAIDTAANAVYLFDGDGARAFGSWRADQPI